MEKFNYKQIDKINEKVKVKGKKAKFSFTNTISFSRNIYKLVLFVTRDGHLVLRFNREKLEKSGASQPEPPGKFPVEPK